MLLRAMEHLCLAFLCWEVDRGTVGVCNGFRGIAWWDKLLALFVVRYSNGAYVKGGMDCEVQTSQWIGQGMSAGS